MRTVGDTKQTESPLLVFVHLGERIPKYTLANFNYIKSKFNDISLWVITDSLRISRKLQKNGLQTFYVDNRQINEEFYDENLSHSKEFRGKFWYRTIQRFDAIAVFQQVHKNPIIHLENDIWIAKDFPFKKFDELKGSIAFPLLNESEGVASVLFLRSEESSKQLVQLVHQLVQRDSTNTDMSILGQIANLGLMNFSSLPTLPPNQIKEIREKVFSENFEIFNGCFDAAAYGVYYLGTDPRNARGVSHLYTWRKEHNLPFGISDVIYIAESSSIRITALEFEYSLFCLHNHSKNAKIWGHKRDRYLNSHLKVKQRGDSKTRKVYFLILLSGVPKYLSRRFQKYLVVPLKSLLNTWSA
jgi:hypothetical protein